MLQVLHLNVLKIDRDIAHVAIVFQLSGTGVGAASRRDVPCGRGQVRETQSNS
jgi:hypothetical protein